MAPRANARNFRKLRRTPDEPKSTDLVKSQSVASSSPPAPSAAPKSSNPTPSSLSPSGTTNSSRSTSISSTGKPTSTTRSSQTPGSTSSSAKPTSRPSSLPSSKPSSTNPPTSTSASATAVSQTSVPTSSEVSSTSNNGSSMSGGSVAMAIAIALIGVFFAVLFIYFVLRRIRGKYKDPKYLPGKWLKNKWIDWEPGRSQAVNDPQTRELNRAARSRANIVANRALDRQSSIRSVITLPPYREMSDMELERTIGREGERDGIDNIVVFPETAEDEENRREERMQAMYELRLQRRQQAAERQARREARNNGSRNDSVSTVNAGASGSTASLTQATSLDMETGGRNRSVNELTAAILNDRTRRSSEVSYGDVGQVRLDGSRIRASSVSSQGNDNGDAHSATTPLLPGNASTPSLSINTNVVTPRRGSVEIVTNVSTGGDATQQPPRLPPSYDGLEWGDAPPYMSPVSPVSSGRNSIDREERQGLMNVPQINITGASVPSTPNPAVSSPR